MRYDSVPKALTRGYSNGFLDMLITLEVKETMVLTQQQLDEMDK